MMLQKLTLLFLMSNLQALFADSFNSTTPSRPCKASTLPDIEHGSFSSFGLTSFDVGTILKLKCPFGYRSWDSYIKCEKDGEWSNLLGGNCFKEYKRVGYGNWTGLHKGLYEGDVVRIRESISLGENLSERSDMTTLGLAPIHLAAYVGNLNFIKYLKSINISLNQRDIVDGNLPIHTAALGGQIEILSYFIEELGIDIDSIDLKYGRTPLHKAATKGNLDIVKWLIKHKATVNATSNDYSYKDSPVHLAAFFGHISVLKYFIQEVSSVMEYWTNAFGSVPMHRAAINGKLAVLSYFIEERGMDIDFTNEKFGRTVLHEASEQGHLEIVEWLVSKGANVNATSNDYDDLKTPMHVAASHGHAKVVQFFVSKFPYLCNVTDKNGLTPEQLGEKERAMVDFMASHRIQG